MTADARIALATPVVPAAPADQLTDAQRERIEDILASLTWEEKLNQAQITFKMSLEECLEATRNGIGALF